MGSEIYPHVEYVWGSEFIETPAKPGYRNSNHDSIIQPIKNVQEITQIGYAFDHTAKTRVLFEINKGINKNNNIHLNDFLLNSQRRIPFQNMIYIADGESDIPAFSLINKHGGKTIGVYPQNNEKVKVKVIDMYRENRINTYGEANYQKNSFVYNWILNATFDIAENIIKQDKILV